MSLTLRTVCLEFGACSDWEPGLRHDMCHYSFVKTVKFIQCKTSH